MAGRTQGDERGLLSRVSRVLGVFSEDEDVLPAARIAERTGLSRSTVYRLLGDLVAEGLLLRTESGYTIGTRLWELGELSPLSVRLRERSLPYLQQLYEATGENVHLAVLDGDDDPASAEALYVARLTGPTSIPTMSRMGGRHPLHTTGVGKALLMTKDDAWLARFVANGLERETLYSVTDAATLRQEIVEARRRGFATTYQEMILGGASIGVPIPRVDGLPQAAVGITAHINRMQAPRLGALLVRTAADIAKALTARY